MSDLERPAAPHGVGADAAKAAVGEAAAALVETGMKVGLGTGSTAAQFVKALGRRTRKEGLKIVGVPTSRATGRLAEQAGVPLTTLDEAGWLDLTIDGADEIDPRLDLIKGGGGALLIEKIVANASDRMVVIADAAKRVETLGAFPLPVEVTPFGWRTTRGVLLEILKDFDVGARNATLRMARDAPFMTDEGNMILDLGLLRIDAPAELASALNNAPGVVESGLFIGLAQEALIGGLDGVVDRIEPPQA